MNTRLIFALCVGLAGSVQAQNVWTPRDSVNGPPKSVCVGFVANGQGYIVTGLEASSFTRKMYSYDVAQNDWDNEQSMGGANGGGLSRGSATAFGIGNKGYVCLGQGDNTNYLNDVWEYDPANDVWTQKADFIGSARRSAVCFVIDDIAYVGTGQDATGLRKDFFKFDPVQNLWGTIADFGGTPRKEAVAFALGNAGYVGTGDDGVLKKDLWQYQVFQNAWIQKPNLPATARAGAVAWGMFPNGYIATGEDINGVYSDEVWEYNYFNEQWTQRASLPATGRRDATAFIIDNIAYLGTGYSNGNLLDDFYAYTGIVGLSESVSVKQVNVYPNPAAQQFTITLETKLARETPVQFYTVDGKNASANFSVRVSETQCFVTPSATAAKGIYCIVVRDAKGQSHSGKVILQ